MQNKRRKHIDRKKKQPLIIVCLTLGQYVSLKKSNIKKHSKALRSMHKKIFFYVTLEKL